MPRRNSAQTILQGRAIKPKPIAQPTPRASVPPKSLMDSLVDEISGTNVVTLSEETAASIASLFSAGRFHETPAIVETHSVAAPRGHTLRYAYLDECGVFDNNSEQPSVHIRGTRSGRVSHVEPNFREVPRRDNSNESSNRVRAGRIATDPITGQQRYVAR